MIVPIKNARFDELVTFYLPSVSTFFWEFLEDDRFIRILLFIFLSACLYEEGIGRHSASWSIVWLTITSGVRARPWGYSPSASAGGWGIRNTQPHLFNIRSRSNSMVKKLTAHRWSALTTDLLSKTLPPPPLICSIRTFKWQMHEKCI